MSIWIDVRTVSEYCQGHLDDAINIPYDAMRSEIATITTDKTAEIHLYCGTGRRAGMAQLALRSMGYTNVHNHGGYETLKNQAVY